MEHLVKVDLEEVDMVLMVANFMKVLPVMVSFISLVMMVIVSTSLSSLMANKMDNLRVVLIFFVVHAVGITLGFVEGMKIVSIIDS